MTSAINIHGLTKRYAATIAVDALSLRVEPGEIYGFLGLNGAGKTTTIRMLLGMVRPTHGTVTLFGSPVGVRSRALWQHVGYLVETPTAYGELTVRENLDIMRRFHAITDRSTVASIIDQLNLGSYADRPARTLSLGNLQRLGLAKALIHRPALLILDEPANGLDPAGVVEIRMLLQDLAHNHGVTVFMSSHLLDEVTRLATRIGILHQGRLREELDMPTLARRCRRELVVDARDRMGAETTLRVLGYDVQSRTDGALVVRANDALEHPERIARHLVDAGVALTRLHVVEDDLEAYFLRLTAGS